LKSFACQTHDNWSLWVSDDGSDDGTLDILRQFQSDMPDKDIHILDGPKKGFQNNFISLARRNIDADYFAISDQDDIWQPEKLASAVKVMQREKADVYGGRTELIEWDGTQSGFSPLFQRPPSFRNALVQSISGGNTMVLNRAAIGLLRKSKLVDVASHDWWIYLLATGAGLKVCYDPSAHILYRQHSNNLVGANNNWRAKAKRMKRLLDGCFSKWNQMHIDGLQENRSVLCDAAIADLEVFSAARERRGLFALLAVRRGGFYRQTRSGQAALYLGALLGRI
jgi:glycosyltransferase involved in cell wall biosynthesis